MNLSINIPEKVIGALSYPLVFTVKGSYGKFRAWINGIPMVPNREDDANTIEANIPLDFGSNTIQVTVRTKEPDDFFDEKFVICNYRERKLQIYEGETTARSDGRLISLPVGIWGYLPIQALIHLGITYQATVTPDLFAYTLYRNDQVVTITGETLVKNNQMMKYSYPMIQHEIYISNAALERLGVTIQDDNVPKNGIIYTVLEDR